MAGPTKNDLCPTPKELSDFALGLLDSLHIDNLSRHVATCSSCQQALEGLGARHDGLLRALRYVGPPHEAVGSMPTGDTTREAAACNAADTNAAGQGPAAGEAAQPANLGRYRVVRLLGSGAFGHVYLARDDELGRDVAIKVPRPQRVGDVLSFFEEARAVAALKHPGIVAVYDVGRTDAEGRSPFVVMEYIRGRPLGPAESGTAVDRAAIVRILAEAAEAIHHAHAHGFVHRDLKPGNILVDEQGHAHVADFGLALHEDQQHQHRGEVAGSPAYMAPEQVQGEAHRLDGRTDIWALGVMLYELLTGRRPFRGRTYEQLTDEIRHREPKPPRQIDATIPPELERICLKCLAKSVTERYTTAADLAADLRGSLTKQAASSTDARPPRRRALLMLTVLVAVAVAATWAIRTLWPGGSAIAQGPDLQYLFDVVRQKEHVGDSVLGALPVRQGDGLRIVCRVPLGMRAGVFLYSSTGELRAVPEPEIGVQELADEAEIVYPRGPGRTFGLDGQAGTEMVLVCADAGGAPSATAVQQIIDEALGGEALPAEFPEKMLLLFNRDVVRNPESPRGFTPSAGHPLYETYARLDRLRTELAKQFAFIAGAAFPHR
jgi:predicted Ser/Thr protein kinase